MNFIKLLSIGALTIGVAAGCSNSGNSDSSGSNKRPAPPTVPVPPDSNEPVIVGEGSNSGLEDVVTCAAPGAQDEPSKGNPNLEFPFGDFATTTAPNEIKLMSFNLENLFDTEHDIVNGEEKNDYYYLPAGHPLKVRCGKDAACVSHDWNAEKVAAKIERLAKVVESQGDLPDVIGFQEIENANVLGLLADRLGYDRANLLITKGPDERGIEVAFLFKSDKLQLLESKEHYINPGNDRPTRNILEAVFELKDKPSEILAVYVNHWPSQGTPMSGWKRSNGAKAQAAAIAKRISSTPKKVHAVSFGDFNTLESDRPHPFTDFLLNSAVAGSLRNDVGWHYEQNAVCKNKPGRSKTKLPHGTYFYRTNNDWNKLDRFFPSASLVDGKGVEILVNSYRIITSPASTDKVTIQYQFVKPGVMMVPNRYNHDAKTDAEKGASDHFPVSVKLVVD